MAIKRGRNHHSYPTRYTLTLTSGAHGSAIQVPTGPAHDDGTVVTITATADEDYEFDTWTVDGVPGETNPTTVTMRANHTAVAAFVSAAPDYLVFDDFNRANGLLGTAVTGQVWDVATFGGGTAPAVVSNRMQLKGSGAGFDLEVEDVEMTATFLDAGTRSNHGLTFRSTEDFNTCIYTGIAQNDDIDPIYSFTRVLDGVEDDPVVGTIVAQDGDVLRIVVSGTTVTWYVDDVEDGTFTFDGAGGTVIQFYASGASNTCRFDDVAVVAA